MAKLIIKSQEELQASEEMTQQEVGEIVSAEAPTVFDNKKEEPPMQVSLNMRSGLDGRIMIFDHDHIDIVYLPDKNKLVAFAKQDYSDIIYETQGRLFDFLIRRGLCAAESVRGGSVYGAMEASMLTPKNPMPIEQLLVLNVEKWINEEKPALQADREYNKTFTDLMTDPEVDESTELGEVPQEEDKGTIPKYASRRYIGGWWE